MPCYATPFRRRVLRFYSLHRKPRVSERHEPPLGLATQRVQRVAAAVLAEEQEGIGEDLGAEQAIKNVKKQSAGTSRRMVAALRRSPLARG